MNKVTLLLKIMKHKLALQISLRNFYKMYITVTYGLFSFDGFNIEKGK